MPWIENVAAADIPTGFHHDAGPNSMLISIVDPASWRPEAKHQFKERHNFEFLDIEEKDFEVCGIFGVDTVKDGKCPDGVAYDWNKASRIGAPKRVRV